MLKGQVAHNSLAASREEWLAMVQSTATNDCWIWPWSKDRTGYARVRINAEKRSQAHRFVYERLVGPIPEGLTLDHICRNRACVNPAHLEPVTLAENTLRGFNPPAQNARKTHCRAGHEYTPENTRFVPRKDTATGYQRSCRQCIRIHLRARRAKKRELFTYRDSLPLSRETTEGEHE